MKRAYDKPRRDGCAGVMQTNNPMDPMECVCKYDAPFDCTECMYEVYGGRKNPQAKKYELLK